MGDLLGDQRGEDLPPDLHQLVRGEVVLQHPVVGAALVRRVSRRHACLVLFPCRDHSGNDPPAILAAIATACCPPNTFELAPMPQKCRLMSKSGMKVSDGGNRVEHRSGQASVPCARQMGVELGILVGVKIELCRCPEDPDRLPGDESPASFKAGKLCSVSALSYWPTSAA